MCENRIIMSTDEYVDLKAKEIKLDMITRAIYVGSDLDYFKEHLEFNDRSLSEFLKIADSERYEAVFATLLAEKEEKDAAV